MPSRNTCRGLLTALLCLTVGSRALGDEPRFTGLGDLQGGMYWSEVLHISADGSAVVGSSESAPGLQAYRWTDPDHGGAGMEGLGDLPGDLFLSIAWGVNADGLVVVGLGYVDWNSKEAFRWTDPDAGGDGMVSIGDLPGDPIAGGATDASADGSVVVGWGATESATEAFRWTDPDAGGDGMDGLGFMLGGNFSRATAISADGSIVVGRGTSLNGHEGFRWTDPGQGGDGMVGIGDLPGGEHLSNANDVSAGGSVVVGAGTSDIGVEAYRWADPDQGGDGMVGLGILPGFWASEAMAVSADGSVIVGFVQTEMFSKQAIYWTDPAEGGTGLVLLSDLLTDEYGLDLTGWTLQSAMDVSADGRTIAGNGVNPDGDGEAWMVYLGTELHGDMNCDGVVNAADVAPFALALVDPAGYAAAYPDCDVNLADMNGDTLGNGADIQPFVDTLLEP